MAKQLDKRADSIDNQEFGLFGADYDDMRSLVAHYTVSRRNYAECNNTAVKYITRKTPCTRTYETVHINFNSYFEEHYFEDLTIARKPRESNQQTKKTNCTHTDCN